MFPKLMGHDANEQNLALNSQLRLKSSFGIQILTFDDANICHITSD